MATMNVSLPESMKEWIEDRVVKGSYSDLGEYIRDLVRREQERTEKVRAMQDKVDEGLASGICNRSVSEILAEVRQGRWPTD